MNSCLVADQIPYFEAGRRVAYNNLDGGVIESLKRDGIMDLEMPVLRSRSKLSEHSSLVRYAERLESEFLEASSSSSSSYRSPLHSWKTTGGGSSDELRA